MFDINLGLEVIVKPAILAVTLLTALVIALRGFYRTVETVDDVEVSTTHYDTKKLARAGVVLAVGLLLNLAVVVVPFGHRAVVWTAWSQESTARAERLSVVFPVLQAPVLVDVREQVLKTVDLEGKANAVVHSSETLEVTARSTLIYRARPEHVAAIIDEIGPAYKSWVETIYRDALREVAGEYAAPEYAPNQQAMTQRIIEEVSAKIEPRFEVISVNLEDVVFEDAYMASVLGEETAIREANKQENLIRAVEAEKKQRITAAEAAAEETRLSGVGEAKRIEVIAAALGFTPEQYLRWVVANVWDGVMPSTLLTGGDDTFDLILNIAKLNEQPPATTTTTTTTVPAP